VPIVLKSGSLNLLETSGPVKACNGIALPLTLPTQFGLISAVVGQINKLIIPMLSNYRKSIYLSFSGFNRLPARQY
jgi:hypothetical protein